MDIKDKISQYISSKVQAVQNAFNPNSATSIPTQFWNGVGNAQSNIGNFIQQTPLQKMQSISNIQVPHTSFFNTSFLRPATDITNSILKPMSSLANRTVGQSIGAATEAVAIKGLTPQELSTYKPKYINDSYNTAGGIWRNVAEGTGKTAGLATAIADPMMGLQSVAVGAGFPIVNNLVKKAQGQEVGLLDGVGASVQGSIDSAWIFPLANMATEAFVSKVAPKLMSQYSGQAYKLAKNAGNMGFNGIRNKLFIDGAKTALERTLIESLPQSIGFGAWNSIMNKEGLVKSIVNEIPQQVIGNLLFTGAGITLKGGDIYTQKLRESIGNSIHNNFTRYLNNQSGKINLGADVGKPTPQGLGNTDFKKTNPDPVNNELYDSMRKAQDNLMSFIDKNISGKNYKSDADIPTNIKKQADSLKSIWNQETKNWENVYSSKSKVAPQGLGVPKDGAVKTAKQEPLQSVQELQKVKAEQQVPMQTDLAPKLSQKGISLANDTPKVNIGPQELNTNNLNITNEVTKVTIKNLSGADVMTKLSNKEIVDLAKRSGLDTRSHTVDQTAEIIAKQLNERQHVVELQKQVESLAASGASPDVIQLKIKELAQNARTAAAQGTDVARQLQARRILANEIDTPMLKVFKLLDTAGVNEDVYTKAAVGVDFKNAKQVATFYRSLVPAKAGEWLDALRYNSMLTSPNTHINNIFSNAMGSSIVAPIEKTITGTLDFFKSTVTGSERQSFAGEGGAYVKGYVKSVGDAVDRLSNVMRGNSDITNLDTARIPLATTGAKAKVLGVLETPMKLLEGMDQFFMALTSGGEKGALKFRESKGVKVGDIAGLAEDSAKYRLFRAQLKDPKQGVVLNAMDEFTSMIQKARNNKNPIVSTISKFTLPFVQTPMNIFKQGLEYSPTGVLTMIGAKNPTEQLSKAIMGASVMLGASSLLGAGRLTWSEPTDAKKKAAFRAAGMQPYAVKIGNNWISYAKLPPVLAFNLAAVAALDDAQKNAKLSDTGLTNILNAFSKYGNFLGDQTYTRTVGDLLAAVKGDAESKARIVGNYVQQLVPFRALGGWMARMTDPNQRMVDTDSSWVDQQVQSLFMNIPGLSQTVKARTDMFGAPIENQNRILNSFSPVRVTTENSNNKGYYDLLANQAKADRTTNELKAQALKQAGGETAGAGVSGEFNGGGVTPLPNGKALYVVDGEVKTANTPELAQRGIDMNVFDKSGKSYEQKGDTVFRRSSEGVVTATPKIKFDYQLGTAQLTQYKNADDVGAYITTATNQLALLQTMLSDPSVDPLEKVQYENDAHTLMDNIAKYKSYGGFSKPKKITVPSASFKKYTSKFKLKTMAPVSISQYKKGKGFYASNAKAPTPVSEAQLEALRHPKMSA